MQEITQALLEYAQANLVPAYRVRTEHEHSAKAKAGQEEALRRLLPEDGQKVLEDYLTERGLLDSMEQEAHFRAGLTLGMQLSRL